ncbi:Metallo-dependent phosphatase-like protein [Cristinia sonorae]|uniref:Metallo-dependent phosphatase-like protein n=1 Tax=Cristinia sonorae TaxID=1940300 RepID=A0A8K0UXE4_9AGAR|nr:Metallo-dependent phosphatase-like protein [Cristinia sonorae]
MATSTQPPTAVLNSSTAVVHLEYDMNNPPALPGPASEWTRFVCLSDTHCRAFPVPPGDVLLHSGDLTNIGTLSEFRGAIGWLQTLPHKHKIIIAGNHDVTLHNHDGWYDANYQRWHRRGKENTASVRNLLRNAKNKGIVYLQEEQHEFQAKPYGKVWSVYGFPWSPFHRNWAFNYYRENADQIISTIPKTDILLTHAPPYEILDIGSRNERAGCKALAAQVEYLRPQLHVFGHIHEDHGAEIHEWTGSEDAGERSVFVNAANKPYGPKARTSGGGLVPFGTGVYSPVIVDLYDPVERT